MPVVTIDALPQKDLAEQAVLVRIDGNDEIGLRDTLPTLSYLSEARARVIIAAHCGTPTDAPDIKDLAARLSEMLGRSIGRLDDWRGEAGLRAVSHMAAGDIVVIENLTGEAGDATGDEGLAEALSRLAEIFCNEAFGLTHEARASTVGIAKKARQAFAGIAFGRQWKMLEAVLGQPRPPSLSLLGAEEIVAAAHAPLASQGLVAHRQTVVEGDPAEEILKLASEICAELIVMGLRGRTGWTGAVLGSVSRKVLDRARCPVLVVHGPGRRSAASA